MLKVIRTLLILPAWEKGLRGHPDPTYRGYLLDGLEHGFRIGFDPQATSCRSAEKNMPSVKKNEKVVAERLATEVGLGRVIGPLTKTEFPQVQISRFGVIPKHHQPGKWRMIVDLSYPKGQSVNAGIDKELCSLRYTTVDEAIRIVTNMKSKSPYLAKFDIESAYRIVPVHPLDRINLGMEWHGKLYVDTALPFGLRSAPKIFNALADGLLWMLQAEGIQPCIHYLDDFLIFSDLDLPSSREQLAKTLRVCQSLGVPISEHKTEGPTHCLTFLGIELDTMERRIRLPPNKLDRLQREIARWSRTRSTTKRELLSLIGQLQHACCVVKPGRSFLRRMISLSTIAKELHHHIRLNRAFRSDLQWWIQFLVQWNGTGMMSAVVRSTPEGTITSDASGNWGCGAYSNQGKWFQLEWSEQWRPYHITIKELLPIILGVAVWGRNWRGRSVLCRCDNAAVVAIIRSGSSRDQVVMELIRSMFFILAHFNIQLIPEHVPGIYNQAADALSRDKLSSFRTQMNFADPEPTELPDPLLELIVHRRPDWTSGIWTALWNNFLRRD